MNKFIERNVESGLFNETVGSYLEEAIQNKESVIIAGHRSTGSRPLFAAISGAAKSEHSAVQVKDESAFEKEADYYLIPGNPKVDLEELIYKAIETPGAAFVSLKDPEQPVSLQKLLKRFTKEHGTSDKVFHEIALKKNGTGGDAVPYTDKVTKFYFNEKGKVKRDQLDF